ESLLGVLPLDVGPLAADRIAHLLQRWHASLCTGADAHQMHTVPRGHWPLPLTEGKFSQGRGKRLTKQFHNLTARQRLELVIQQEGIAQHRDLRLVASLAQRGEKLRDVLRQALAVTLRVEIDLPESEARLDAKRVEVFLYI